MCLGRKVSLIQHGLESALQDRDMVLNDVPHNFIVHTIVSVDYPIPERHNPGNRWYFLFKFFCITGSPTQRFSDDLKLSLHRGAKQAILFVLGEANTGDKLLNRITGPAGIKQTLPHFVGHKSPVATNPRSGERTDFELIAP